MTTPAPHDTDRDLWVTLGQIQASQAEILRRMDEVKACVAEVRPRVEKLEHFNERLKGLGLVTVVVALLVAALTVGLRVAEMVRALPPAPAASDTAEPGGHTDDRQAARVQP